MSSLRFKHALRRMRHTAQHVAVDEAWVRAGREQLLKTVSETLPAQTMTIRASIQSFFAQFIPARLTEWFRRPALALLSIFGLLAGGSVASVSAAERAVPGDFLYPLKIVREQASLVFAKTKTEQLQLKTSYVGRRVEEVRTLATSQDASNNGEKIKETVDVLKRDFDTVQTQLAEVKNEAQPFDVATTAKLIDKQTDQVVQTLKDVKPIVAQDVQNKMTEAQAAAVDTSVKAVQTLIDVSSAPGVQDVVSGADLVKSVQDKVSGLQQNIAEATQKLVATGMAATSTVANKMGLTSTSSLTVVSSTAAGSIAPMVASTSIDTINSANKSLNETRQLISEQNLQAAKDTLGQAAQATASAETSVAVLESVVAANASSSAALPSGATGSSTAVAASSTPSGGNASTSLITTTSTLVSASSSDPVSSSTSPGLSTTSSTGSVNTTTSITTSVPTNTSVK